MTMLGHNRRRMTGAECLADMLAGYGVTHVFMVPAFEPVTKFNATVDDVARFPDMVRQAFRVAVSGTPGPVHLQFRGNEGQVDQDEAEMEPLVEEEFARVPPFRPMPDDASLRAALEMLQAADRPVIIAGGGV